MSVNMVVLNLMIKFSYKKTFELQSILNEAQNLFISHHRVLPSFRKKKYQQGSKRRRRSSIYSENKQRPIENQHLRTSL